MLKWAGDCVSELPRHSVHLAYSEKTRYEAAVLDGIHYLIQGDGQASTSGMLEEWFANDRKWALEGSGIKEQVVLQEAIRNEKQNVVANYERLFDGFLRIVISKLKQSAV